MNAHLKPETVMSRIETHDLLYAQGAKNFERMAVTLYPPSENDIEQALLFVSKAKLYALHSSMRKKGRAIGTSGGEIAAPSASRPTYDELRILRDSYQRTRRQRKALLAAERRMKAKLGEYQDSFDFYKEAASHG